MTMASFIVIGNLTTESIELNTSTLNLNDRIPVDHLLTHGYDICVVPTGGLTENEPHEFILPGGI